MATEINEQKGPEAQASSIEVVCPADGRVVGEVPDQSAAEIAEIAARLRAPQPAWQALGFEGRALWLGRFRDWLLDHEDEIHRLGQSETGKSWGDVTMGEVAVGVEVINYFIAHAAEYLAPVKERPHSPAMAMKKLVVEFTPFELVGVITPWNAQLGNAMLDIPAALMAGSAVLSKPSEETPLTWAFAVRGWKEIGAPDVLECATGRGETGAAIVDEVDMIQFTGSTATGKRIAARAAERLIYASLELGGKDATIVCADADLERAAGAVVWGGFYNSGQICVSVERVYVEAAVYERFLGLVTEKARAVRTGMDEPGSFRTDYGAMATSAQLDIVERHVQDARDRGATIVTGGSRTGDGLFFEPTVLTEVDHTMLCMREETFGPTLPIMKVADVDEAIRLANDSPYGLAGSVWTTDETKGRAIARRMRTGSVNINNAMTNVFQLPVPMGGWGESGIGSRHGAAGIRKYCRSQTVVSERLAGKSEIYWYPTSARRSTLMARASRLLGAKDWRRRLGR